MDAVAFWANLGTLAALLLTAIALFVTARQLWTGRRAASAGSLIALNESLRQAWLQFSISTDLAKQHTFSDVMNLLEGTCAAYGDGLFVEKTGGLVEHYLCHVFKLIEESDDSRARIERMFLIPGTFQNILHFLEKHKKQISGLHLPARQN